MEIIDGILAVGGLYILSQQTIKKKVLVTLIFLMFLMVLIPTGDVKGITKINEETEDIPYNTFWFKEVDGFEKKGSKLNLVLVFKNERSIDLIIGDGYIKDNYQHLDVLDSTTFSERVLELKRNLSGGNTNRFEADYENIKDDQMYVILFNPNKPGDESRDYNDTTARLRIDMTITDVSPEDGSALLTVLIIILSAAIVAVLIGVIIVFIKRKKKDAKTFWDTSRDLYYAFVGPGGTVYYFSYEQYANMYQANGMQGYEYLGQSRSIGGEVIPDATMDQTGAVPGDVPIAAPVAYPQPYDTSPPGYPMDTQYPEAPMVSPVQEPSVAIPGETIPEGPAAEGNGMPPDQLTLTEESQGSAGTAQIPVPEPLPNEITETDTVGAGAEPAVSDAVSPPSEIPIPESTAEGDEGSDSPNAQV